MEETPEYTVDMTEPTLARILQAVGLERLIRMAELIDEVIDDSGWGDIVIVIAERRVVGIKAGKSYK
jgi:hypothetical protein